MLHKQKHNEVIIVFKPIVLKTGVILYTIFFLLEKVSKREKKMAEQMDVVEETKITDLNTDCLIGIFKNLSSHEDLLSVKQANRFFSDAIDFVVRATKIKILIGAEEAEYEDEQIGWYERDFLYTKQLRTIQDFLREFGKKIESLAIIIKSRFCVFSINLFFQALIEHYCNGGNIKHCVIEELQWSPEFLENNLVFFRSLESLEVTFKDSEEKVSFYLDFIFKLNVKQLKIYADVIGMNPFKQIAQSRLQTVFIEARSGKIDYDENNEIPINTTLKDMDLSFRFDSVYLRHFPNIENLCYAISDDSSHNILSLVKLKQLNIFIDGSKFDETSLMLECLANRDSLESLLLWMRTQRKSYSEETYENKLTSILCKMANLKNLELGTEYEFVHDLPRIGEALKKLETFSYYGLSSLFMPEANLINSKSLEFVKNQYQ